MYSDKINLIREKITSLLEEKKEWLSEKENLLERIRVLEEELKFERSGTGRPEKKPVTVQHSEKINTPTLFDDVQKEEIGTKLDDIIGNIDQCIEIIEK
jgi:hypothetical protein